MPSRPIQIRFKKKLKKNKMFDWWKKEENRTIKESHGMLNKDGAKTVAFLAMVSVACSVFAKIMILMRWSTFPENAYFSTWHPYAPVWVIISSLLYIYCLKAKGVDYWLAYFPAVFGIFFMIIEMSMIHSWMHPEVLKSFFGPLAEHLPDILTGGKV